MAHPVLWRGKTFFYPIGNTSAVCLTQDLCPTEKADVLLLGCGDPRHILYTVYTNSTGLQASRKLDFTCCDLESAVIARNVILFTLLADEGAVQKVPQIWNIFLHFYLDKASHDLLISQCKKLVEISSDLDSWNNSPYGHFLRMCTGDTLIELRRLWQLYVKTTTCSPSEAKEFASAYGADVKASKAKFEFVFTASRAAGPLSMYALKMAGDHYNIYWETGVCSAVPKRPSEVSYPNPTFAYSMVGDKFGVHYGTDPLSCFHLAEAFAPAIGSSRYPDQFTLKDIVNVCKTQFDRWCTSVSKVFKLGDHSSSSSPLIIRCFVGDALSLCQALDFSRTAKTTSTSFSVAPWKTACIIFDPNAYGIGTQSPAPTTFNVIDTSNLLDYVGVLNLIAVTSPILQRTPSATLYTEGLASGSPDDTLAEQLCGDIATMGLLLGLIPACFVSQFTNRSNMHEHIVRLSQNATQNHERLAWKLIGGAEKLLTDLDCPIDIAPEQLACIFFDIYLNMFSHENVVQRSAMAEQSPRSIKLSGIIHYHRRSFVEILGVVKRRVLTDWDSTMNLLHGKIQNDRTLIIGMNSYQDLCCQLHLLGVFNVHWLSLQKVQEVHRVERPFVFRDWKTVPQTLCVAFVVPRHHLQPLLPDLDEAGTPVLQCDLKGVATHNRFSVINTVFGTITTSGQGDSKTAAITEDATGRDGTSPLVVWFWVPSIVLVNERRLSVVLSVFSTPATCTLATKRPGLSIFRADLGDEQFVHILRQRPNGGPESPENNLQIGGHPMKTTGACTLVTLDRECKTLLSFTTRVDIVEPEMKASMTSGVTPIVNQVSMHSIAIVLGDKSLQFPFPLPIDAKKAKLRIARKSLYIEIILPLKLVLGETESDMFPVIPHRGDLVLWNMHRVNLDQCIPFSIANKKALGWVNPHVSLMMSDRERRIPHGLTTGSTLLDVKRSLHFIFGHASGLAEDKPPLCYALQVKNEPQIFVMFYITDLRLDVGSHTMVADTWVMPSSPSSEKFEAFSKVSSHLRPSSMKMVGMGVEERKAWMYLLVAATERCRTWEHKTNCEYRVQGAAPLTLEPSESPICSCGAGVGTESFMKKYPMLRPLAPYVTRAVISPLFALSYMEKVGNLEDIVASNAPPTPAPAAVLRKMCAACGKEGGASGSLSTCGRCKVVQYCSQNCQRKDWKGHKKSCVAPSS